MFIHKSDQSRRVEQIGDSEDGQTADASPDPAAVLHLNDRKRLTLGQVELDVPLRQSLQGHVDGDEQVRHVHRYSSCQRMPVCDSPGCQEGRCCRGQTALIGPSGYRDASRKASQTPTPESSSGFAANTIQNWRLMMKVSKQKHLVTEAQCSHS